MQPGSPTDAVVASVGVVAAQPKDLLFGMAMHYVYILASRSRNLYIGVTGNLDRHLIEHKQKIVSGFSSRYNIDRLVHYEIYGDVRHAIAREKELKDWRQRRKLR